MKTRWTNWVCKLRAAGLFFALVFTAVKVDAVELCTAIADGKSGRMLVQEGTCNQRVTPASTFKIAISLMGYDAGFLMDDHTPVLPFRDGYPDWIEAWKVPTDPHSWMQNSVVWYSQRVTERLGAKRFKDYVQRFRYGNQDVSGNPGKNDGLTQAWLTSSLKISPLEQLEFLEKFIKRELPVSVHAYAMTERITLLEVLPSGWEVHGKTGTGFRVNADNAIDRTQQIGWFVGWATKQNESRLFVHCIQVDALPPPHHAGPKAREELMAKLQVLLDPVTP